MKKSFLIAILMAFAFHANAYHWTPITSQYANTASVVGVVSINNMEQTSTALELGAFCGNECRGRENLMFVSQLNRYYVFLTLYGNDGDELTFRLFDHSSGHELDATCSNTISFATNGTFGNPATPIVFEFAVQSGYHWTPSSSQYANTAAVVGVILVDNVEQVSANIELGAFCGNECRGRDKLMYVSQLNRYYLFLTLFGNDGDELSFKLYDHGLGQELDLVCASTITFATNGTYGDPVSPFIFTFTGGTPTPPQPYEVVITLDPGWTWMSYLLTTEKTLSQALVNLTPGDGDMVKGQKGYSYYDASTGQWSGSLSKLVPGKGYMYLNNGTATKSFTYPAQ